MGHILGIEVKEVDVHPKTKVENVCECTGERKYEWVILLKINKEEECTC